MIRMLLVMVLLLFVRGMRLMGEKDTTAFTTTATGTSTTTAAAGTTSGGPG